MKMYAIDSHHKVGFFSGFIGKRKKLAELRREEAEKRKAQVRDFRPIFVQRIKERGKLVYEL